VLIPWLETAADPSTRRRDHEELIKLSRGFITYIPAEDPCGIEYLLAGICGFGFNDLQVRACRIRKLTAWFCKDKEPVFPHMGQHPAGTTTLQNM
jgi:hypothetical protein